MSDRVAVMNLGRIEQVGGPREVYAAAEHALRRRSSSAPRTRSPRAIVEVLGDGQLPRRPRAARDVDGRRRAPASRSATRRWRSCAPSRCAPARARRERQGEIAHLRAASRTSRSSARPHTSPSRRPSATSAASPPAARIAPRRPPTSSGTRRTSGSSPPRRGRSRHDVRARRALRVDGGVRGLSPRPPTSRSAPASGTSRPASARSSVSIGRILGSDRGGSICCARAASARRPSLRSRPRRPWRAGASSPPSTRPAARPRSAAPRS